MSTPRHLSGWLESLLEAAHGPGSARLAVFGQWDADRPYWAGLRFFPVRTLLEAVLRCVLAAPYQRVVVCSGFQRERLPKAWRLGADLFVGAEATVWLALGAGKKEEVTTETRFPWETPENSLGQPTAADQNRLIWRSGGRDFQERLKGFGRLLESEIQEARRGGRRTALLVEGGFFQPTPTEWSSLMRGGQLAPGQAAAAERSVEIPATLAGSPVDVILFSEDSNDEQLLSEQGHLLGVSQPRVDETGRSDDLLPRLRLGPGFELLQARRQVVPFAAGFLEMDLQQPTLYRVLQGARLNQKSSVAVRPEHPERVALEFWADLDIERPRRALDEEVIGQDEVKKGILAHLERIKTRCRDLLDRNFKAVKTAEHRNFLPPVFGLFGAAGMGKTTFCKVLGRSLMGDDAFFETLDFGGKDIGGQTIGIAPSGAGYDQKSPLIRYAERTAGLGLVCIDEFTRAQLLNQTLADALGPLLQILQDRSFVPANGQFRPARGRFHLVNTVFVFAGNVAPPDRECPPGFTALATLGPAFSQRIAHTFYFEPLRDEDFVRAIEVSLKRGAREFALDFEPDRADLAGQAEVTEALRQSVLFRFRQAVGGADPSLRALQQVIDNFNFRPPFDALKKSGDRLVLDVNVLGEPR